MGRVWASRGGRMGQLSIQSPFSQSWQAPQHLFVQGLCLVAPAYGDRAGLVKDLVKDLPRRANPALVFSVSPCAQTSTCRSLSSNNFSLLFTLRCNSARGLCRVGHCIDSTLSLREFRGSAIVLFYVVNSRRLCSIL